MTEKEQENFLYLEQFGIYGYIKRTLFSLRCKNMIQYNTNGFPPGNEKNCLLELDKILREIHPKTINGGRNDQEFTFNIVCEYAGYLIPRLVSLNYVYDYPNFKNIFISEIREVMAGNAKTTLGANDCMDTGWTVPGQKEFNKRCHEIWGKYNIVNDVTKFICDKYGLEFIKNGCQSETFRLITVEKEEIPCNYKFNHSGLLRQKDSEIAWDYEDPHIYFQILNGSYEIIKMEKRKTYDEVKAIIDRTIEEAGLLEKDDETQQ